MKGRKDWEWYVRLRKRKERTGRKSRELSRIFLGISLSLILSISLIMSMMYRLVKDIITEQNVNMSIQAFTQVQTDFEEANQTANMLSTQIFLDDICSAALHSAAKGRPDSITLNRVRRQLSLYNYTNPAVESIYLYNDRQDLIISSGSLFNAVAKEEFRDKSIISILSEPEKYDTDSLICREKTGKYPNHTEWVQTVYSYVLFDQNQGSSAVIVNMNFDSLMNKIQTLDIMKDSCMLIINGRGERLLDLQADSIAETDEMRRIVTEMVQNREQYREATIEGEKYFISYLYSPETQWNYVKVTRWDSMFGVLNKLRRWTLGAVASIAAVILVVAAWNSVLVRRLQRKMEKKLRSVAPRVNVYQQKENFLNNFLHSRKVYRKEQLREEMEQAGFHVSEQSEYTVLIMKIENYDRFVENYGKEGAYNVKFGFQNIFEEIFREKLPVVGLINRDDTLNFLLDVTGATQLSEMVQERFQSFCSHVRAFVKWDFFCLGTEQRVRLEKIPELKSDMQGYVQEGFFYPSNSCVTCEQIAREHTEKVLFQNLETDKLQRGIQNGQDITELYGKLVQKLGNCSMMEYMQVMTWIGISMIRSIGNLPEEEIDVNGLLLRLTGCQKSREVERLFEELFASIYNRQEGKSGMAGRLDEVKEFIANHYTDPNITLQSLGDEFGVSPNYLGRLFKKDMGVSVVEYINEIRLQKILKELTETEDSAKDIAERNGFLSNNYFYTYFKKKVGVTPQAYRERGRKFSS